MNRIKTLLKILYVKWVQGECRHFCCLCDYKYECYSNLESEVEYEERRL